MTKEEKLKICEKIKMYSKIYSEYACNVVEYFQEEECFNVVMEYC